MADAGNPYPFGEADRPLADFGLLFGGRIGAVGPEARLFEIEMEEVVDLLANRIVSQFTGDADQFPGRRVEVVAEQGVPNLRDGDQQHRPDEQDDHGEFNQRISPVSHFPNC